MSEPALPDEQRTALRFDLATAYESQGDHARARAMFELVERSDPEFRDVTERLAALGDGDGAAAPAGQEDAEEETFESFDDVIADAEAALGAAEEAPPALSVEDAVAEAVAEAVLEPDVEAVVMPEVDSSAADDASEPEAPAKPKPARKKAKKRRKKKISFG